MKRTIAALAAAATLTTAIAPSAFAMGQEFNMLTGALFNTFKARGIPTDGIDRLTLSEIALIKTALESSDSEAEIRSKIMSVLGR